MSPVRRRVLAHLRRIATAPVAALSMTACHEYYDALPEPASCATSSDWTASVVVTGAWQTEGGVRLSLRVDGWVDAPPARPEITGGTLESMDADGRSTAVLVVAVDADAVDVMMPMACDGDERVLRIHASVPAAVADGDVAVLEVGWD